jgi:hypothetical protein
MNKHIAVALAAVVATVSLSSAAYARNDEEWRRDGHRSEHRDNRGFREHDRRADRGDRRWSRDRWHHHGWRNHGWRPGYWGGPRVVIRPGYIEPYCFIKKVRRYDDWGNMYVKRVRVCR